MSSETTKKKTPLKGGNTDWLQLACSRCGRLFHPSVLNRFEIDDYTIALLCNECIPKMFINKPVRINGLNVGKIIGVTL